MLHVRVVNIEHYYYYLFIFAFFLLLLELGIKYDIIITLSQTVI